MVQNVPSIFDAAQHLYDGDKKRWRFILCGSSARKLRLTGANLLPGRALLHRLYPLVVSERPFTREESFAGRVASPLPLPATHMIADEPLFPATSLIDRLIYGELPAVAVVPARDRAAILQSYTSIYPEEELRREALIKDWGVFARFLQLAASESGQMLNYAKISKDAGVSLPTVKSYYQLLEDMFVGFRVGAFTGSPHKNSVVDGAFFLFRCGRPQCRRGAGPAGGDGTGKSRALVRAMGGYRAVETIAVSGNRKAAVFAQQGRG